MFDWSPLISLVVFVAGIVAIIYLPQPLRFAGILAVAWGSGTFLFDFIEFISPVNIGLGISRDLTGNFFVLGLIMFEVIKLLFKDNV